MSAALSRAFFSGLRDIAAELGTPAEEALAVLYSESWVRADAVNGAHVGIAQIDRLLLRGLGFGGTAAQFAALPAEQQLPTVAVLWRGSASHGLQTGVRLYQATVMPRSLAAGAEPAAVLCRRDDPDPSLRTAYARFSSLDTTGKGHVDVADLQLYLDRVREDRAFGEALQELLAPEPTPTPTPTPTPVPPTPTPLPPTPTPGPPPTPTPGPVGTPTPPPTEPPPPPTPTPRATPPIFLPPPR